MKTVHFSVGGSIGYRLTACKLKVTNNDLPIDQDPNAGRTTSCTGNVTCKRCRATKQFREYEGRGW